MKPLNLASNTVQKNSFTPTENVMHLPTSISSSETAKKGQDTGWTREAPSRQLLGTRTGWSSKLPEFQSQLCLKLGHLSGPRISQAVRWRLRQKPPQVAGSMQGHAGALTAAPRTGQGVQRYLVVWSAKHRTQVCHASLSRSGKLAPSPHV